MIVETKLFLLLKVLDSNNDGFISKSEFSKLMRNMSMDQVLKLKKKIQKQNFFHKVNQVMGKFDNDSDGLLDLEEFKALMNRNQKKKTDN